MKPLHFTILFGCILAAGMVILKLFEYHQIILGDKKFLYGGIIAALFLGLGFFLAKKSFTRPYSQETPRNNTHPVLSSREREILSLIETGKTNQEIADALFVSINTVKTHIKNIFEKLEVNSRAHAVAKIKNHQNTAINSKNHPIG